MSGVEDCIRSYAMTTGISSDTRSCSLEEHRRPLSVSWGDAWRWMAKVIYALKPWMFRGQFKLTAREERGLSSLCCIIIRGSIP